MYKQCRILKFLFCQCWCNKNEYTSLLRVFIAPCSTTGAGLGDIYQHADKGASQVYIYVVVKYQLFSCAKREEPIICCGNVLKCIFELHHLSYSLLLGTCVESWYPATGSPPSPADEQADMASSVEADEGDQRSPRMGQVHCHRPQQ